MRPLGDKKDFLNCRYGCCPFDKARRKARCLKKKARRKDKVRIIIVRIEKEVE